MLKAREKERLQDCLLMIQSARNILFGIREADFPQLSEIERCFRNADEVISRLLRT
jgi:hypothetical protein